MLVSVCLNVQHDERTFSTIEKKCRCCLASYSCCLSRQSKFPRQQPETRCWQGPISTFLFQIMKQLQCDNVSWYLYSEAEHFLLQLIHGNWGLMYMKSYQLKFTWSLTFSDIVFIKKALCLSVFRLRRHPCWTRWAMTKVSFVLPVDLCRIF